MKNLYIGITMILVASHQSYYGLTFTGLEFFKPYPIGKANLVVLLLLKVAFFFALTYALVRYSKLERLINHDLPISKIIVVASLIILFVSSPFNAPFTLVNKLSALILDTSIICIFFTLLHMFVLKNFSDTKAQEKRNENV